MKTNEVFKQCQTDHTFLLKDYAKDFSLFTLILAGLLLSGLNFNLIPTFKGIHLVVSLLSIPFGWMIASQLHNSGHGNYGTGILNRFIGELTGFLAGYGHYNFILVHTLHHKFSDHEHDPVNPEGMNFVQFLIAPTKYMIAHTKGWLREVHGHNESYETILAVQTVLFYLNLFLRQALLLLLLGPAFYISFYLVAVSSNIGILAHINYYCHQKRADGSVEVVNLDHNLYYKAANFVTGGGYYHKNHHLNMRLLDPRNYKRKERRLFTVQAMNHA
jgi:fatty acid desaturase